MAVERGRQGKQGSSLKLEELLGRRVRYERDRGRVVEGQSAGDGYGDGYVVIMTRTLGDAPPRLVRVPERDWVRIEVIG